MFLGRVVGPGEPLWLPDDADKVIAYRRWEASLCGTCRTRKADWLDADGLPLDPPPYQPVAHRCPGCADVARLNRHLGEMKADVDGAFVALEPFDPDRRPFDAAPEGVD